MDTDGHGFFTEGNKGKRPLRELREFSRIEDCGILSGPRQLRVKNVFAFRLVVSFAGARCPCH